MTRIVSSKVNKVNIPLSTSFAISKANLDCANNVFVRICNEHGHSGLGEAAPFPALTGDTQDIAYSQILQLTQYIQGHQVEDSIRRINSDIVKAEFTSVTARAAVEMALYDLKAKSMNVPLHRIFGFAERSQVVSDITMPIMAKSSVGAFWNRYQSFQFPYVKIKVGHLPVSEDVDRIVALSQNSNGNFRISLDGNQGCTAQSALAMLDALKKQNIVPLFFEQPLDESDWRGMADLSHKSPVPICADETVKTASDAIRVVRESTAKMVNLKIMKSGVHETLRIANILDAANIPMMIGGMVESEIGMGVSLHLLCGTGIIDWCDLDTPFFLQSLATIHSPWHANSAVLQCPIGAGLGLETKYI